MQKYGALKLPYKSWDLANLVHFQNEKFAALGYALRYKPQTKANRLSFAQRMKYVMQAWIKIFDFMLTSPSEGIQKIKYQVSCQ